MNNNFLENSITKNIFIVISLAIIVIYLANKNKQENFVDINQAYKHHANKRCTSIYGNYHPKCAQTSRLNHVGYFKYNTIKYPLVDLNNGSYNIRYIMLRNKFVKLNKKYWNRGYYFPKPFFYNKNVPFSFVMNFLYRGIVINTHTKKMFYIFGKNYIMVLINMYYLDKEMVNYNSLMFYQIEIKYQMVIQYILDIKYQHLDLLFIIKSKLDFLLFF